MDVEPELFLRWDAGPVLGGDFAGNWALLAALGKRSVSGLRGETLA